MKNWWQPSLARRVLLTLMAAFLLVWCVLIAVDYLEYRRGLQPRTVLEQLAKNIVESLPAGDIAQAVAVIKATELQYNRLRQSSTTADVGQLLIRLAKRDGLSLYASSAIASLAMSGPLPDQGKLEINGRPYWSTVQESGEWRLQLLEPVIDDTLIVRLLGGELLLPMLIAFPFVLLPLWFAVWRGLRPLRCLVDNIKAHEAGDFTPLVLSLRYAELQPLVNAFNHLLETARQGIERERAFVQDAAHELRTPLAVVSAQAYLLSNCSEPGARDEAALALERAVQRTSHLVHQLLTLAALEGESPHNQKELDLVEVARGILIAAAPRAATKDIEVALESPDELNVMLDSSAFHSILGNLLDNALAYCPAGSSVTVVLGRLDNEIQLREIDNGPGISPDDQARLFERFFRGGGVTTNGSGLGLSIVQQAVKRMAGKLDLQNLPDRRGLIVSLRLPASFSN